MTNKKLFKQPKVPAWQQAIIDKCYHPTGEWNEFHISDIESSIVARFEQQVRKYPARLAVKIGEETLTYAQLNQQANQLAWSIIASFGEGPEPVALYFEHGIQVLVAFLGVLKSGKFYVPMDIQAPRSRNQQFIEDLQTRLILTNAGNLDAARELASASMVLIAIDELTPDDNIQNPHVSIAPDAYAYITYTSGSTGQPKGVIIDHRNVLKFTQNATNQIHYCTEDRIGFTNSFNFNGAASAIYPALLNGAALLPFNAQDADYSQLGAWLSQEAITVAFILTALLRQLVNDPSALGRVAQLRLVTSGGERLLPTDVEQFQNTFPSACLFRNGFGTSEVKVISEYFTDCQTPLSENQVPVGYATADVEILLLDESGNRVGFDQVGEIAVKSHYMAAGYWGKPSLTQAKFLTDPEGSTKRIYLTGDLGLMRPDGCLYHMGRKDFQVKIRGYRVEPHEVEAVLFEHEAIVDAVVVAHTDQSGAQFLVAYVVPVQGIRLSVTRLRRHCEAWLPPYMMPTRFQFLERWPLNANGKLDRKALPRPEPVRPQLDTPFAAPETMVEEQLVTIWRKLLSIKQIGIHDNFFELGGHSLLATQLLARIQHEFQLDVGLRTIFEKPTVAGLAECIETIERTLKRFEMPIESKRESRQEIVL